MKLIVGLGNPGRKYEQTRHNVGFDVADKVASLISASPSKTRFEGLVAEGQVAGEKVVVLWPQTYMNASGQSVRKAMDFFKLPADDLLVICDDMNLASGRLRLRASGSSGGQKGIADTIGHLRTEEFPRLKIGIGRPPDGWEVTDYVLGKFSASEKTAIDKATTDAAHAIILWVSEGITIAMNRYNTSEPKKKSGKMKARKNPADSNPADSDPAQNDPPAVVDGPDR